MREDDPSQLKVKSEFVFVVRPSAGMMGSTVSAQMGGTAGVANRVVDVQEKGPKGFVVQTVCPACCSGVHTESG